MENIIVECSCQQNNLWTIITTIVPILVAIAVPCLIARKQNKITLYEKRFECYQRLESLKSFFLYVKEISSFVASPEQQLNPAWICQQRYFSAHALLDDKDFQNKRFDYFHRISYARSCLEEDRKMLLSLGLLVGINKKDRMDKAQDALEGFIALLFNEDKKVNKGKDAAASAYVLARSLYAATGKTGVHSRYVGLDRDTNKELLLKHIRQNNEVGTPFKELQQVLPGLNRNQIQVLMRELKEDEKVVCKGKTSAARWFIIK